METDVKVPVKNVQVSKSLGVTDPQSARTKILDIAVWGDPNAWVVLAKASSEQQGWMKSTKALPIDKLGVLVQVSTQQKNEDGTYSLAEALQYIPGAKVVEELDGSGKVTNRKLRHL